MNTRAGVSIIGKSAEVSHSPDKGKVNGGLFFARPADDLPTARHIRYLGFREPSTRRNAAPAQELGVPTGDQRKPAGQVRLVIADDHPLFLAAVQAQIERTRADIVIVTADSLDAALRAAEAEPVAALMLDFSMPGMGGVAGVARARAACPNVPIVIMSGTANPTEVTASVRAGANGFLPKSLGPEIFIQALNVVLAGGTYLPTEIVAGVTMDEPPLPPASPPLSAGAGESGLTPREMQVLQSIVNGKSNKEIARDLALQEVTVKLHARRVYHKLGARNRAEVTAIAIERKIVQRVVSPLAG